MTYWRGMFVCAVAFVALPAAVQAAPPDKGAPAFDCMVLTHPDQVVAKLNETTTSCNQAVAIYFSCQDRWVNNPQMEEAAINRCDAATARLTPRQAQRYENAQQACETRFQSKDMRILWSAVRDCKVRLAQSWARRYPAKK